MKFEYEEFETIEDVLIYLVSVAPYMKQILPISSYKEHVFSMVPITPLSGDVLLMIYTKGNLDRGMYEFDISTKKHKIVAAMERADKNYFIVITPKKDTLADAALNELTSCSSSSNNNKKAIYTHPYFRILILLLKLKEEVKNL